MRPPTWEASFALRRWLAPMDLDEDCSRTYNECFMLTSARIAAARERIRDVLYYSPCQVSHDLSELAGHPIYLKLESLQRTGAFKERGALNRLLQLTPEERAHGVIAASAGEHAQGAALS